MFWFARKFFEIAIFKSKPQDLPANVLSIAFAVLYGVATYVLAGAVEGDYGRSLLQSLLDLCVSGIFVYSVLYFQRHVDRFTQTYSALIGSGAVVNLVAAPLILTITPGQPLSQIASLLLLLLFAWSLALCAFIFRAAFELTPFRSAVFSMVYVLLVMSVTRWVFPY